MELTLDISAVFASSCASSPPSSTLNFTADVHDTLSSLNGNRPRSLSLSHLPEFTPRWLGSTQTSEDFDRFEDEFGDLTNRDLNKPDPTDGIPRRARSFSCPAIVHNTMLKTETEDLENLVVCAPDFMPLGVHETSHDSATSVHMDCTYCVKEANSARNPAFASASSQLDKSVDSEDSGETEMSTKRRKLESGAILPAGKQESTRITTRKARKKRTIVDKQIKTASYYKCLYRLFILCYCN